MEVARAARILPFSFSSFGLLSLQAQPRRPSQYAAARARSTARSPVSPLASLGAPHTSGARHASSSPPPRSDRRPWSPAAAGVRLLRGGPAAPNWTEESSPQHGPQSAPHPGSSRSNPQHPAPPGRNTRRRLGPLGSLLTACCRAAPFSSWGFRAPEHGAGSSRATHGVRGSARSHSGPAVLIPASPSAPASAAILIFRPNRATASTQSLFFTNSRLSRIPQGSGSPQEQLGWHYQVEKQQFLRADDGGVQSTLRVRPPS
ncbi:hypothetical protein NDU88_004974 [Pleurodeles waltl]|uniref:Uncharacterized protein n=1 Tax=Pleurodeles waltl TaxID=8319 RepID=A0AAV7TSR9_PLEWA|nr:hypothetical protein NDU88_004974 [Pleurodeles waltl]